MKVLLVSLDVYRFAAQEQLEILAKQINVEYFKIEKDEKPKDIALRSLKYAKENNFESIIYDTAGRLHIDNELMEELKELNNIIQPIENLLVAGIIIIKFKIQC
jgi:signal recognition particle subunit SRP54